MIFFINSQGTTVGVESTAVNQGSAIPNGLVVVCPFASNVVPSVSYTLPNGLKVLGNSMTRIDFSSSLVNGVMLNAWACDLEAPVTQYAGTVKVQFKFAMGNGEFVKSYETQFTVGAGIDVEIPTITPTQNAQEVLDKINDYLASIGTNVNKAIEDSIAYIRYQVPSLYLLNSRNATLSVVGDDTKLGEFTVASMTDNVSTDADLLNPSASGDFFYRYTGNVDGSGFLVSFPTVQHVGTIQFFLYNITKAVRLTIETSADGIDYSTRREIEVAPIEYLGEKLINQMRIIQVFMGSTAKYIRFTQNVGDAFTYKGLELWEWTAEGEYKIMQTNGNSFIIPTYDFAELQAILEGYRSSAEYQAEEAKKWATGDNTHPGDAQFENSAKYYAEESVGALTQINSKAGQVGGYPVLENIDGAPKIPAIYINQVDIHNQIEITNESKLATITAEPGDVAYLVETINGVKTVTKSWILLSVTDNTRNWAVYGTSYATNAGNAQYATSAGNAQQINGAVINKLTQAQYNALADKTGVYFVTID